MVRHRSGVAGLNGHVGQTTAHELMVPQLGGDDRSEAQFHREPRERSGPQFPKPFTPVRDLLEIKVAGSAQRIFAEKLRDVWRFRVLVKTVERRAKDDLASSSDGFRNPALR